MSRLLCAALPALSIFAIIMPGQESGQPAPPPAAQKRPANDIFSGSITELTADSLTVVQKVPARDAVTRKFALVSTTKVEGRLHLRARVTVRYEPGEDGQLRALHIIVR